MSLLVCAAAPWSVHMRCADTAIATMPAAIVRVVLAIIGQFYDAECRWERGASLA
jgi:hypothetical protein